MNSKPTKNSFKRPFGIDVNTTKNLRFIVNQNTAIALQVNSENDKTNTQGPKVYNFIPRKHPRPMARVFNASIQQSSIISNEKQ